MKKWLFLYAFLHFSINIYSQKDISLNFDLNNRCIDLPTNVDWLLEVNDVWGARKLKIEVSDEYYIIDTSSWSKDMYILKATIGEKVISSKIVIK